MEKAVDIKKITDTFGASYDFEMHTVYVGGELEGILLSIDGLVSGSAISEDVLRPLTSDERFGGCTPEEAAQRIAYGAVYNYSVKLRDNEDDVIDDIMSGFCVLFIKGYPKCLTFETKSGEKRSVDMPKEEKVVKGAKDAFVEIIKTNSMLIRRRMKNKNLRFEAVEVGEKTKTQVICVYIDGFTNPEIVQSVKRRIGNIKCEGALMASDIEENIEDAPLSPFPQLITTERPDKFCLNLLEGRVGIIADGIPVGFLAPGTFTQFFKVPEDKSNHYITGTILTLMRYLALVITLLLPALYVAVAMYHQEMIPTKMMLSIIQSKQAVPFPTAVEVIGMLIAFELLQEAGLRLPDPIGQTVSIIGALIVGQSAVEAKVVSPVVIIVVAMAGIAGYTMPNQDMSSALRICRFLLVLAAVLFGMYGIALGLCLIIYHLCSLEVFGIPYMTPFVGNEGKEIKKAFVREPAKYRREKDSTLFVGEDGEKR